MDYLTVPNDEAEVNVLYHKIEKLDHDLRKRDAHLAELIDEVVYAEDQKEKSVRRAEAARYLVNELEGIVQNLLGYVKVVEANVLMPAFLDLSSVVPQEPVSQRRVIAETLDRLSEDSLTARTKKLIGLAKELPSETRNRAAREAFLRSATEESVRVEDAVVLGGLLLEKKDELTALLDDLHERVQRLLQGSKTEWLGEAASRSESAAPARLAAEQARCAELQSNAVELERRLAQLTHERDALRRDAEQQHLRLTERRAGAEEAEEEKARRTALEERLADVQAQNAILLAERQEQAERIDDKDQQIATLQRTNDALRRELFEVQQKMLSSSPPERSSGERGLSNAVAGVASELSSVERRITEMSERFQEERGQIIAQFNEERTRFKAERQECDTLVERMATELEQLAMENRSLRATAALRQL